MGREIRVTIDDDEVFERMKARKRELDLSWREVLHRGLWAGPGGHSGDRGGLGPGQSPGPTSLGGDLGDRIERRIRREVEDSLLGKFGEETTDHRRSGRGESAYGSDVEDLERAEDAVLRFPFLEESEDPRFQVPLRVNLETGSDGLDVDVVAVRTGKSVEGTNAFDRQARMGIAQGFSRGALGTLELGDGAEQYSVSAGLTWSRDAEGRPTVSNVTVEEVVFDDER